MHKRRKRTITHNTHYKMAVARFLTTTLRLCCALHRKFPRLLTVTSAHLTDHYKCNVIVTGAPYSMKSYSLSHSWTLWWRLNSTMTETVPSWGLHLVNFTHSSIKGFLNISKVSIWLAIIILYLRCGFCVMGLSVVLLCVNREWYRRNFSLLWLATKVDFCKLLKWRQKSRTSS